VLAYQAVAPQVLLPVVRRSGQGSGRGVAWGASGGQSEPLIGTRNRLTVIVRMVPSRRNSNAS
jgi:hypothetical protein